MSTEEFPNHAIGEPCPVIDLLIGHFGEKVGEYLLWEFTCFPCSDEHAWEQARTLVAADRVGLLREFLRSERAGQDTSMWLAARDYVYERIRNRTCTKTVFKGFNRAVRHSFRHAS